jgi:hypothetical protein
MASFEGLVMKLLTEPKFAQKFLDEKTRAQALDDVGINSSDQGLLAALQKIDYKAISAVRQILDPLSTNKN